MKLLLITAIREFEKNVKDILNHSGVKSLSYQYVKGCKNESDGSSDNWFGASHTEIDSVLFTVFIDAKFVDEIYKKAEVFNSKQKSLSHIHVATVELEKSI
jgi:nitrogen regulatory protein PII